MSVLQQIYWIWWVLSNWRIWVFYLQVWQHGNRFTFLLWTEKVDSVYWSGKIHIYPKKTSINQRNTMRDCSLTCITRLYILHLWNPVIFNTDYFSLFSWFFVVKMFRCSVMKNLSQERTKSIVGPWLTGWPWSMTMKPAIWLQFTPSSYLH